MTAGVCVRGSAKCCFVFERERKNTEIVQMFVRLFFSAILLRLESIPLASKLRKAAQSISSYKKEMLNQFSFPSIGSERKEKKSSFEIYFTL